MHGMNNTKTINKYSNDLIMWRNVTFHHETCVSVLGHEGT